MCQVLRAACVRNGRVAGVTTPSAKADGFCRWHPAEVVMGGSRRLADPERDGTVFTRDLTAVPQMPVVPGATVRPATAADAAALQEVMEASGAYPEDVAETRLRAGRRPYVVETE